VDESVREEVEPVDQLVKHEWGVEDPVRQRLIPPRLYAALTGRTSSCSAAAGGPRASRRTSCRSGGQVRLRARQHDHLLGRHMPAFARSMGTLIVTASPTRDRRHGPAARAGTRLGRFDQATGDRCG
jgi:hypothetical protein